MNSIHNLQIYLKGQLKPVAYQLYRNCVTQRTSLIEEKDISLTIGEINEGIANFKIGTLFGYCDLAGNPLFDGQLFNSITKFNQGKAAVSIDFYRKESRPSSYFLESSENMLIDIDKHTMWCFSLPDNIKPQFDKMVDNYFPFSLGKGFGGAYFDFDKGTIDEKIPPLFHQLEYSAERPAGFAFIGYISFAESIDKLYGTESTTYSIKQQMCIVSSNTDSLRHYCKETGTSPSHLNSFWWTYLKDPSAWRNGLVRYFHVTGNKYQAQNDFREYLENHIGDPIAKHFEYGIDEIPKKDLTFIPDLPEKTSGMVKTLLPWRSFEEI